MPEIEIDVTECPDCGQKGRYDGRFLINGRGVYSCPERHLWQDSNEKPTNEGVPISPPSAPHTAPRPSNYRPYA